MDTLRFFQSQNVQLKIEKNNAVFPVSDKAETIRYCLEEELKKKHVLFRQATVQDIQKNDETFTITAQEGSFTTTWKSRFVIVATGGKSYEHTGSTGFGYTLAQQLGHTIVPTEPGLVQLVVDSNPWKDCQGISLSNIGLRWKEEKKYLQGDFLFTEKGFSGPVVFDMSLDFFTERVLCIDFLPHCSMEEWAEKVQEWRTVHSKMQITTWLQQWFPKKTCLCFATSELNYQKPSQEQSFQRKKMQSCGLTFAEETRITFVKAPLKKQWSHWVGYI